MKYLLIADIHSNYTALEAVIKSAGDFDEMLVVGDFVGYGPQPNKCIETVKNYDFKAVKGNHDAGVLGELSLSWFNRAARVTIEKTKKLLSGKNKSFLENLPKEAVLDRKISLVHGSPRKPLREYMKDDYTVTNNLKYLKTPLTVVGHVHIPLVFEISGERVELQRRKELNLRPTSKYVINPGSVGQPRDGDPRASYAILNMESRKLWFRRVAYDILAVQRRMQDLGFPLSLRRRISKGV